MQISQAEWIFCGSKGIYKLIAKLPSDIVVKQARNLPRVTLRVKVGLGRRVSLSESLPVVLL